MSSISAESDERTVSPVSREIQALRAFAVLAVLLYHLWPARVSGGFVGVDVFFVVSGFLITAHLARELSSTGTISLSRFWARRARRLLPASFLVLAVTALATLAVVPRGYWQQFFREIGASALYIENWALAADAVDYLAAENIASPVQHYWSLGVEEQIYLVWPVLLIAAAMLARRVARLRPLAVPVTVLAVLIASFVFSVTLVTNGSAVAFFATPARVWEFAAGGLLALASAHLRRIPAAVAAAMAWTGWIGLTTVIVLFDDSTPFPGHGALLPVAFTLLVISAGAPAVAWSPSRFVSLRPIQWLGDVSYSTYLWHWPLIVLLPFALERELTTVDKFVILAITLVLAALSTRFVEQPFRFARWSSTLGPRVVLAGAVTLSLVFVAGSVAVWTTVQRSNEAALAAAAERAALADLCFGAGSLANPECSTVELSPGFVPTVESARDDRPVLYGLGCRTETTDPEVKTCTFGVPGGTRVALIGDSHAASWFPTLNALAEKRGWELTTYFKGACGFSLADRRGTDLEQVASCLEWNTRLIEELRFAEPFSIAFTSTSAMADFIDEEGEQTPQAAIEGFHAAWQVLRDKGTTIVPIRDLPLLTEAGQECQEQNADDPTDCAPSREQALALPDYSMAAAAEWNISTLDMTDYFCGDSLCSTVTGGVLVYRDSHHFTATYALSLTPYFERELIAIGVIEQ